MQGQPVYQVGFTRLRINFGAPAAFENLTPRCVIGIGYVDVAPRFGVYTRECVVQPCPHDLHRAFPDNERRSARIGAGHGDAQDECMVFPQASPAICSLGEQSIHMGRIPYHPVTMGRLGLRIYPPGITGIADRNLRTVPADLTQPRKAPDKLDGSAGKGGSFVDRPFTVVREGVYADEPRVVTAKPARVLPCCRGTPGGGQGMANPVLQYGVCWKAAPAFLLEGLRRIVIEEGHHADFATLAER